LKRIGFFHNMVRVDRVTYFNALRNPRLCAPELPYPNPPLHPCGSFVFSVRPRVLVFVGEELGLKVV